jgi:hypothetical protein
LEVAFEEGAGVFEVLFGVGFGGGEARKRFVQQADDPLLFGERGDGNFRILDFDLRDIWLRVTGGHPFFMAAPLRLRSRPA